MNIEVTIDATELKKIVTEALVERGFKNPKLARTLTGTRLVGHGPMESEQAYFDGMVFSVEMTDPK